MGCLVDCLERVIFNVVNFSKHKNLFKDGMTPLVKSTSRPKWQRIPRKYCYYYRSPDHHNHHVLSFAFGFDKEDDVYQFAFSYPYSYSRCQAHLDQVEKKLLPHFQRELLINSVQQRRLDLITITHPENMQFGGKRQRVVVILSRIHPGESPSSYVCQGLIDFLISSHPIAQVLREHIVFKIVPMLNPDGVFLGNYRSTLMGFDLNRTWHQISRWAHPTLHAVNTLILELDQNKEVDLDLIIDLHAHSSLQGVFMYGNTYDDVYRYERHIVFPKIFSQNAEDYVASNTMYNRDTCKAGTARRHFCESLKDSVNCYTLEVSFHGYRRPNDSGFLYYTEESYCRIGRNLARAYLDYYRAIGVITVSLPPTGPSSPEPRRVRSSRSPSSRPRSRPRTARRHALVHLHDFTTERRSSMSSEESPEERPHHHRASHIKSQVRQRPTATVHLKEVPAPESVLKRPLVSAGLRSLTGKKVGGGGTICYSPISSPVRPLCTTSEPPYLSIIDFNLLTRGGLDQATGRSKSRSRGRSRLRNARRKKHYSFSTSPKGNS